MPEMPEMPGSCRSLFSPALDECNRDISPITQNSTLLLVGSLLQDRHGKGCDDVFSPRVWVGFRYLSTCLASDGISLGRFVITFHISLRVVLGLIDANDYLPA